VIRNAITAAPRFLREAYHRNPDLLKLERIVRFHQDTHGSTIPSGRTESAFLQCRLSAFIQTMAQAMNNIPYGGLALVIHHELKSDNSGDPRLPRIIGVLRFRTMVLNGRIWLRLSELPQAR
jgi:hypothetical protein